MEQIFIFVDVDGVINTIINVDSLDVTQKIVYP